MFHAVNLRAVPAGVALPRLATVCVFGGARSGRDGRLAGAAAALGRAVGTAGLRLVYGGGSEGLMGCVALAAARHGSEVIAITPRFIEERFGQPAAFGQRITVPDMHMRKRLMFEYSDAFVALPGGIGTIEELAEVMTLGKLDQHAKPVVLANFGGFWSPWLALLGHLETEGFLCGSVRARCLVVEEPEAVLEVLRPRGHTAGTAQAGLG
jgi:uncharacterized protein (TIGR00730 family)